MKVLVTGVAGFIGMHAAKRLLDQGDTVVGIDNLNGYYDVRLKEGRLQTLQPMSRFRFQHLDIADRQRLWALFESEKFDRVLHLAAQAGVRYSLQNPHVYVESNLVGFANVLDACRHHSVQHLVYASSSSVYGGNTKMPFSESDPVDQPVSLYAATKKANELLAYSYSHLYALPTTGLRFFTVYGPWGRPDMAYFLFTRSILEGKPIDVFNHGNMKRDFTYIDDVVEGVLRVLQRTATPAPGATAPARVFNIGNNRPVQLNELITLLETHLGKSTGRRLLPMQPGDVHETYADVSSLEQWVGFRPSTPLAEGIERFVSWYLSRYGHHGA